MNSTDSAAKQPDLSIQFMITKQFITDQKGSGTVHTVVSQYLFATTHKNSR